jgi:hypothetical protein
MEVSLPNMVLLPMVFNLAAVVVLRIYYTVRDSRRSAKNYSQRIFRCTVCRHVYEDVRDVPLSRCPRCSCLNEPVRR